MKFWANLSTNLLEEIVKRRQILSVNVCGVADEVVAVVARLADLLAEAAGVSRTGVLHATVASAAFHLKQKFESWQNGGPTGKSWKLKMQEWCKGILVNSE